MNELKPSGETITVSSAREAQPIDIGEVLLWLRKFGMPSLLCMDGEWVAVIQMTTTAAGASFKVRSGYRHETPHAAIQELVDRVIEVTKQREDSQ